MAENFTTQLNDGARWSSGDDKMAAEEEEEEEEEINVHGHRCEPCITGYVESWLSRPRAESMSQSYCNQI